MPKYLDLQGTGQLATKMSEDVDKKLLTRMDIENPTGTGNLTIDGNGSFTGVVSASGTPVNDDDLVSKKFLEENYASKEEPAFTGDIIVDGEIKATNVPYTISEQILLTIPAATIQDLLTNGVKKLTIDAFDYRDDLIIYANYGGLEYASMDVATSHIEFFIANPYVTDGFACTIDFGIDADGNTDETKACFQYRVLDTENVTDLIFSQLEVSYIDSKYFDHDLTIINSISMNRRGTIATYSTALGSACVATGHSSFATGLACEATGAYATAVGKGSFATGEAGLSTGLMTTAGREALATGRYCNATGRGSLATGNSTTASGNYSVAEGQSTTASSTFTHAEGQNTTASKTCAHAEGIYTLASSNYQHVQGKYNIEDAANVYAHIVGNGTGTTARKNAHTLDWNGNAEYAGDVIAAGCGGESPISLTTLNSSVLSLEESFNDLEEITSEEVATWFS